MDYENNSLLSGSFENYSTEPNFETQRDEEGNILPWEALLGVLIAFCSCFFIGISVIFKKLVLNDIETKGKTRASEGGYGYLYYPKWWLGISCMALGELTNFVAYIFAPAILITPLGVFSIVVTVAMSPYFLKERVSVLGKVGCVLVVIGCAIITICGPKDKEIETIEELQSQLLNPGFITYSLIVALLSMCLMVAAALQTRNVIVYIVICSSIGSLSVMFCKGVGMALKEIFRGANVFTNWATWFCLISLVVCIIIETIYMQRALDLFSSSLFMSVNYVFFSSLVFVASSILYTEIRDLDWKNLALTILGFVINIIALYILYLDKENTCSVREEDDSEMEHGEKKHLPYIDEYFDEKEVEHISSIPSMVNTEFHRNMTNIK